MERSRTRQESTRSTLASLDRRYIKVAAWYACALVGGVAVAFAVTGDARAATLFGVVAFVIAAGAVLLMLERITHETAGRLMVAVAGLAVGAQVLDVVGRDAPAVDQSTAAFGAVGIVAAFYVAFERRAARALAASSAAGLVIVLAQSDVPSVNGASIVGCLLGVVLCVDIIVSIKQEDRQLAVVQGDLAGKDELTGLLNRRGIAQLIQAATPGTGLMLVDLDHFKRINDTYGHAVGDQTLRRTADVLQQKLRGHDLAARWGGEEFLIVLPQLDTGGYAVAERLRTALAEADLGITASIGFGTLGTDESVGQCLERVDRALYEAKERGRNQTVQSA
ncbi:sensor domain-containing diguanylate cyclase [Euzebya tangerina]|uniref:GGDEF domain-containing protein n=1 Tax=Euzebya tangerina TaxID=591198 RepID=UPI0013C2BFA9|nr:GGDEF domain-containing protein [Euzebya tangerina]